MTDITTRLLSMSEAMYMDRSQEEVDALLLEAKGEIERLREARRVGDAACLIVQKLVEFIPIKDVIPATRSGATIVEYFRAALIPQQKGNADGE